MSFHLPRAGGLLGALIFSFALLAGSSVAQSHSSPEISKGLQLLFLGTNGGPPLDLDRSEPSTLLIVEGRPYLIDCGIGTIRRLLRANIQSETIGTIFFTHLHSDHDLGLADVMANDFFRIDSADSAHTINIYGPPRTEAFVSAAFDYIRIPNAVFAAERLGNPSLVSPFKAHEIQGSGLVYQDDKIRVIAAENTHYILMPPDLRAKMKSYSLRFETADGVVVFTGDTGPSDAVTRLANGADVLISESTGATPAELSAFLRTIDQQNPERAAAFKAHMIREHLNLEQIGEIASKARVTSVILYHYGLGDSSAYPVEVKKHFSGPVFAPTDLDRYCLAASAGEKPAPRTLHPCRSR